MNIKDLEYFHQLALRKNFSQVADHFGVSQPTITMAIKRLEKHYQLPLVIRDRSHQRAELTIFGRQLAVHVRAVLGELVLAEKAAAHGRQDRVRFGLPPIIGSYYFPSLVPKLLKRHLLRRLEVVERGSNETLKELRHGDVDFALLGSLSPLNYRDLAATTIATMPFGILVAKKSPLANRYAHGISFKDLRGKRFISLNEQFIHSQAIRQLAAAAHFRPQVIYQTADVHVLGALVAEEIGVAFLTSMAANINPDAVLLPLKDDDQPLFYISKARRQQTLLQGYKKDLWEQLG